MCVEPVVGLRQAHGPLANAQETRALALAAADCAPDAASQKTPPQAVNPAAISASSAPNKSTHAKLSASTDRLSVMMKSARGEALLPSSAFAASRGKYSPAQRALRRGQRNHTASHAGQHFVGASPAAIWPSRSTSCSRRAVDETRCPKTQHDASVFTKPGCSSGSTVREAASDH